MPRSKIIYGDEVLIDLTGDTVTADTLAEGVTAHDAAGNAITGTLAPENLDTALARQETLIEDIKTALEGKAAASVETCTVTLSGGIQNYAVTTCDNGIITYRYGTAEFTSIVPGVIELTNVVCNSIMTISASGNITGFSITGTSQSLNIVGITGILSAPTQPEECFIAIRQQPTGGGND